jgi:ATPase subunit of ABC transporter with duplicated ATPase domains
MSNETVISFRDVTFRYEHGRSILDEASFSVRKGSKITIMGQNGAGKSTLFKLITGVLKNKYGMVNVDKSLSIATAFQSMPQEDKSLEIRSYFRKYAKDDAYNIDVKIQDILDAVNLKASLDRIVGSFSG